jgi:hypothetical protein
MDALTRYDHFVAKCFALFVYLSEIAVGDDELCPGFRYMSLQSFRFYRPLPTDSMPDSLLFEGQINCNMRLLARTSNSGIYGL